MKCIVTHYRATENLAVLLSLLQAQLLQPDEIIVIDTSPNKTGLEVAQKFMTNSGVPIRVECARVGIYEAWNRGIDLAGESDVLIMNDDVIIPINTIDVFDLVSKNTECYCLVCETPPKDNYKNYVSDKFSYYSRLPENADDLVLGTWMPGFFFYLSKRCIKEVGLFDDKHFKCWYGDDDYQARIFKEAKKNTIIPIIKINSVFIYHYGGSSYEYQTKQVQKIIDRDRKSFKRKYGQ